jgi:hypothetical protein
MREIPCLTMFDNKPWPFGRPLYLGSKLAGMCESVGQIALLTKWNTGKASNAVVVLPGKAFV